MATGSYLGFRYKKFSEYDEIIEVELISDNRVANNKSFMVTKDMLEFSVKEMFELGSVLVDK